MFCIHQRSPIIGTRRGCIHQQREHQHKNGRRNTPTESKVGESHRSGAHRKNGEKRDAAGEPSRSGWSAPAGRRPDGGPAAGFLRRSRPRSPTPRAESENEKGRREKTEKGRREKRRCLVNSVPLGPTGRRGKAVAANPRAALRDSFRGGTWRSLDNRLLPGFEEGTQRMQRAATQASAANGRRSAQSDGLKAQRIAQI